MKRLESLDALRGFDMLFIMGFSSLVYAISQLYPEYAIWQVLGEQMGHAEWDGLRHHDTIFPLFLFIAGVTLPFSLAKQVEAGKSNGAIYLKIVKRGLMLVFLGLLYNSLLKFHFDTLRFCSVLSRIGLAWMLGAIIYTSIKSNKIRIGIIAGILIGYYLINALIIAPDAPAGEGVFTKMGNIGCYIDRTLLGAHCYRPEYDPEGLFSTIPAIATALLGMLAGEWLKREDVNGNKKTIMLIAVGAALGVVAWAWNMFYPINKALWSSSFVCAVGSYSFIMLALFYYIIDVKGWKKWAKFFVVIGLNSITIYMAQRFSLLDGIQHKVFDGTINLFPEEGQKVVENITWIATCWIFLYLLYRKKIFLKV